MIGLSSGANALRRTGSLAASVANRYPLGTAIGGVALGYGALSAHTGHVYHKRNPQAGRGKVIAASQLGYLMPGMWHR